MQRSAFVAVGSLATRRCVSAVVRGVASSHTAALHPVQPSRGAPERGQAKGRARAGPATVLLCAMSAAVGGRGFAGGGGGAEGGNTFGVKVETKTFGVEVEKKFMFDAETERRIAEALPLKGEVRIEDSYFDTPDFRLTTQDFWLRVRDGAWELKEPTPSREGGSAGMDVYNELTEERDIAAALERLLPGMDMTRGGPLEQRLFAEGCEAFCTLVSARRKYGAAGGVGVDLDVVVAPEGFSYAIGEVEVMAGDAGDVPRAEAEVDAFIERLAPPPGKVALGKVLALIKHARPEHFQALQRALGDKYPKLNQV